MVATLIFAMFTLGVYALVIQSYDMTARIRYRDDARAMLLTFVDQFQRLETTTEIDACPPGSGQKATYTRWLFYVPPPESAGPNSLGLKWGSLCSEDIYNNPLPSSGVPSSLKVALGGTKNPIDAYVTREIFYVLPTGETSTTLPNTAVSAAGWMIAGKFNISYVANGRPETASMTVVRSVK